MTGLEACKGRQHLYTCKTFGAKTGKVGGGQLVCVCVGGLAYLGPGTAAFSQEASAGPVGICGAVWKDEEEVSQHRHMALSALLAPHHVHTAAPTPKGLWTPGRLPLRGLFCPAIGNSQSSTSLEEKDPA